MTLHGFSILLALTSPNASPNASPNEDGDAAARQVSSAQPLYIYGDDDISGQVLRATGAQITNRRAQAHKSLIELRPHFVPELVRLARDM